MPKELFPGRDSTINPQIYAYTEDQYIGYSYDVTPVK